MVVHPVLESRFFGALEQLGELDLVRTPPRAIRVIEEQFA
jgi:homoserine dehydrogenase